MTVSPWLVLAGALLGAGLGAALLGHLDTRQHRDEDEQAAIDDQFAQIITTLERQR
ncbi:hypothetical protein ABZW30_12540 [Kitasatospora sp. NPDC004669]|uniref:hypothetical protein n=1 Tax=Kitasatospora sp. NPDC004669 TaxID=3154555 RepID=UPI0033A1CC64